MLARSATVHMKKWINSCCKNFCFAACFGTLLCTNTYKLLQRHRTLKRLCNWTLTRHACSLYGSGTNALQVRKLYVLANLDTMTKLAHVHTWSHSHVCFCAHFSICLNDKTSCPKRAYVDMRASKNKWRMNMCVHRCTGSWLRFFTWAAIKYLSSRKHVHSQFAFEFKRGGLFTINSQKTRRVGVQIATHVYACVRTHAIASAFRMSFTSVLIGQRVRTCTNLLELLFICKLIVALRCATFLFNFSFLRSIVCAIPFHFITRNKFQNWFQCLS